MQKKLFSCLSIFVFLGLVGCQQESTTSSSSSNLNGLTSSSVIIEEDNAPLNFKMLQEISHRLTLKGTINEKYGIADNILNVEVSFTESSYHWIGEDEYCYIEVRVFNFGGIPTLCGVNLNNERFYQSMTNDQGEVESWQNYANPFANMTIYDFLQTKEKDVYDFRQDLEQNQTYLMNYVIPTITNYQFWDLEKAQITIENNQIQRIYFESSTRENTLGNLKLIADFEVVATNEDVKDLEYPDVLPTLPEHEKLRQALQEVAQNPIQVVGTYYDAAWTPGEWEEAEVYIYNAWNSEDFVYVEEDNENPRWHTGSGYLKQDGKVYGISMESDDNNQPIFTRTFYEKTDSSGTPLTTIPESQKPNFLVAAPEWFTEVEENVFVCDDKTYAGTIAHNYSATRYPYARSSLLVKVTLNDEGHIDEIAFTDDSYTKGFEKFVAIGSDFELPFKEDELNIQENPFNEFLGTYTGSCKLEKEGEKQDLTIVISSETTVTVNGTEATDLQWDKNRTFTFKALGCQFEISHSNGSSYYYIYVNSEDGEVYIDYCQPTRVPLE